MKEIEESAYKSIPLEILKYVAEFCEKHEITYSLHYGTLLGAIRHKGYIPWDDDIDIVMPRKDYEKFRAIYNSNQYPLVDLLKDKHYPIGVAKIYDINTFYYYHSIKRNIGLFIDVFVLDNFPDDLVERKKWLSRIGILKELNTLKNTKYMTALKSSSSWKRKILITIGKLIPISSLYIHKSLEKLMRKYESINCKCVGCPIDIINYNYAYSFPKEYFDTFEELEFENCKFMATTHYDSVLRILYGDYMELPPESKRVKPHGIKAYYK